MKAIFLFLLFSIPAYAISEKDFSATYDSTVKPFYDSGAEGSFSGTGGITIRYKYFLAENEKGAIVVSPGRAESYVKFSELAYDLHQQGYSVYLIDHRGQGFSDRLLPNKMIDYVDGYSDYVADFKIFIDTVVNAKPHSRLFLLGNSMGGLIAALYLEKYPTDFTAAVLSVPMLQINTGKYPEWFAHWLGWFNCKIGKGKQYAPGQGDSDSNDKPETQKLTHSAARFKKSSELTAENPSTRLGGVSNRWAHESFRSGSRAQKDADKIGIPVLLLQAGQDVLVMPKGQKRFCDRAAHCALEKFPAAYHELFFESDELRDKALHLVFDFLSSH